VTVSAVAIIDPAKLRAEIAALGMTQAAFARYARIEISELSKALRGDPLAPETHYRLVRGFADARLGRP
jgi:transcriptional regulator with XRE-family HTH domain